MGIFLSALIALFGTVAHAQMGGGSRTPYLSSVNSTTTALTSGSTFTGEWEQCFHWSTISVAVSTDLAGTLKIQFSSDGTNLESTLPYDIKAGVIEPPHKLEIFRRYCRVTFTNDGATTQSYLRLQTIYGQRGAPMSPLNLTIGKDADAIVVRSVSDEILIGEGLLSGYSMNLKFGRNADIDTATVPEDIWGNGGVYTGFPTGTPELVEVVSDNVGDDLTGAGCEKLYIQGLDANGVEQNEEITLDGTTPVDSTGTYSRVNRAYCTQSNNGANDTFNLGQILVRHTTTVANVFIAIPAGFSESQVACYTVPLGKVGFIRGVHIQVNKANTAVIDAALWIRDSGKSPRLVDVFSASDAADFDDDMFVGIKLEALTDVCARVTSSSANNVSVTSHIDILVVEI